MRTLSPALQTEKEELRQYFISKAAFKRFWRSYIQTCTELDGLLQPVEGASWDIECSSPFPPRQPVELNGDFLAQSALLWGGTASRRKHRRMKKQQKRGQHGA